MRGTALWLLPVAVAIAACAAPALPAPESEALLPTTSPAGDPATFCAGRTWPPYPLGDVPGVTARSTDAATIEISNGSSERYYYRVSGWEPTRFETCNALAELEVQRGPIDPGATELVTLDPTWRDAGVQVTVAYWQQRCGEACAEDPFAATWVELSPKDPVATDAP